MWLEIILYNDFNPVKCLGVMPEPRKHLTKLKRLDKFELLYWFMANLSMLGQLFAGILKGKYHCTVDLLFHWFGISCITTGNFCFYLQNRLIQTSQKEVNSTVILPPSVFPAQVLDWVEKSL